MYGFIKGIVDEVVDDYAIIDANGVGYLIYCDLFTLSSLVVGTTAKIYTHLQVKEDALTLYGFRDKEAKRMFEMLLTVNGVGAKVAMRALSKLKADEIMLAILTDNAQAFKGIQGLGPKISARIMLELKPKLSKVSNEEIVSAFNTSTAVTETAVGKKREAIDALIGLGYTYAEASACVKSIDCDNMSIEDIIFHALKSGNK